MVAARPNFVKVAPLVRAMHDDGTHEPVLIHAGQHYDDALDAFITRDLGMVEPQHHLGVGSGTHAYQVGETMCRLEKVLSRESFSALVVAGDVNATLAGALVAAKSGMALAHLEAGIRSYDRSMPEEINRVLTDQLADICLTPTADAAPNLLREGIDESRIHFIGNCMIDSLDAHIEEARSRRTAARFGDISDSYGVLTLHRPANVDDAKRLSELAHTLARVAEEIPLVFPVHPRTLAALTRAGVKISPKVFTTEPLGYLDFLSLIAGARLVLTDSGGIQEETTVLGIPCITMRENTERPITVTEGTNRLTGHAPAPIIGAVSEVLASAMPGSVRPEKWDGRAGKRAAAVLAQQIPA